MASLARPLITGVVSAVTASVPRRNWPSSITIEVVVWNTCWPFTVKVPAGRDTPFRSLAVAVKV
ncbi:hypothetical protein D3C72_1025760 [compost metagenome]